MGERWKEIIDTNGLYYISNYGRVKRVNKTKPERILKTSNDGKGYLVVSISDGKGNVRTARVHKLVALHFIPNPYNYPVINHKDENPFNNHADNLEWCTVKYNTNYNDMPKRRCKNLKKEVVQLDDIGNIIARFESVTSAAKETGSCRGDIIDCCKGRRKQLKGYSFIYG